jgi:hypothetical protein
MDLKDKILGGYAYMIVPSKKGGRLMTGKGGVHLFIDGCREKGLSDEAIQEAIYVNLDDYNDPVPLKYVSVHEKTPSEGG